MSIELLPRGQVVAAWPRTRASATAAAPALDDVDGSRAIRVPVAQRPLRERNGPPSGFFFFLFFGGFVARNVTRVWGWLLLALGLAVLLVVYRSLRLPRLVDRDAPDVWLGSDGLAVGRLRIPWGQVGEVVRLQFGVGDSARCFLAVRVRDFVGVRGLTPFWAGLANQTRRRLVVLARTDEVRDPEGLARALERLVARPEERLLLSSETGAQLVRGA